MKTITAINAFIQSRVAKNCSPETIKWYKTTLKPFAIECPDMPGDPTVIEAFLSRRTAGDERRHGYFRALKAFYRFSKRYNVKNAVSQVDAPVRKEKLPRPVMLDDLDQLLSFPHQKRILAAIMFMADCGARVGETSRLEIKNLYQSEWGPVAVVNGKTGERLVPVSESTYKLLQGTVPFNLSANYLSRLVNKAFREAHIKGTAHCLRHTFGTYWDGDETVLQKIMGHANIQTTQIYRKLRIKKMCELHREYSPLKAVAANRQMSFFNSTSRQ